jgi:tetratricopeptide (TPR) repeat protein
MRLCAGFSRSKTLLGQSLLGLILNLPAPSSVARQTDPDKSELGKIRGKAATQHEIAVILLDKKEFEKAASEAGKIFEMKWPQDQEAVLLKELKFFADQFLHRQQAPLGLQLLEKSSKWFKLNSSHVEIWKEKGFLYKQMNQMDKALDCFREAQRLEKSNE